METKLSKKINWEKCDPWLKRIAQFASILTSIALAVFAGMQIYINNRIHEEDKALHQPIFQIKEHYYKSEGSDIYDYEEMEVYNNGESVQQFNNVNISTYLRFAYWNNEVRDTFYIPINGYFSATYSTPNLTGQIKYTKTVYLNYGEFGRIFNETKHSSASSEITDVLLIHVTKINYIDLFGEKRSRVFINKNMADEKQVAKIEQRSKEKFIHSWFINELSLSKIKEICYK